MILALDLETTDADPETCDIVEIARIDYVHYRSIPEGYGPPLD